MNKPQQLSLLDFFDEIRKAESAQNLLKNRITNHPDLLSLFQTISLSNTHITPSTLKLFLVKTMELSPNDLYTIFAKFDSELKGEISFQDFQKQLKPVIQNPQGKGNEDIRDLIMELFQSYIDYQDLINVCRKELRLLVPYQMFDQIATERKGYIGQQELSQFYSINDRRLKQSHSLLLMHGLRRRSYTKITLQAFCQNLNPLEMGYYRQYTRSIEEYKRQQCQEKQRVDAQIAKGKKRIQDKITRATNKDNRMREAEADRNRIRQQMEELRLIAQKQKEERRKIQRSLQMEQKIRHNLESEIKSFKREYVEAGVDRDRVERMGNLHDEELIESRELDERIGKQQEYLSLLKQRLCFEKSDLLDASNHHQDRIANLRREDNRSLRELQVQQESLYHRLMSPVTQKSMYSPKSQGVGKIYKAVDTPAYELYKSSLGSTKEEPSAWGYGSQLQPKFSTSYLYRY